MVKGGVVKEVMVHDAGNLVPVRICDAIRDIMLPRHHLEGGGVPEGLDFIESAVGCSQHIVGGEDGASADWNILSS